MIEGINPLPTTANTSNFTNSGSSLGKDDFLKLLVAQLQAQDPLEPMSAQDFSAQLAQFSALEQMTNVNVNLEKIQKFEAALANASAINLIGKTVNAPGNAIDHQQGQSETLAYTLEGDASEVLVEIFDQNGGLVRSLGFSDQGAGTQSVAWNGRDIQGNPLAAGVYTFRIEALDESGNSVNAVTFAEGRVTDVIIDKDQAFVIVNGDKLAVSDITRIST